MNDSLTITPPIEIYDSAARVSPAWREAREVWQYRSLLRMLIVNAFRMRYRRSALGIVWLFVYPLMNMAVLSIAFSAIFRGQVRDYPLYVLVGFLVWNFFTQTTTGAIQASISGNGLSKRVYLPRTLFLVADAGVNTINFFLGLGPLALVALALQFPISPTWLLFPIVSVFLLLFALGVGMIVGVLAVYLNDVAHVYQLILPGIFFLTPIVYPISILPEPFQMLAGWNPLYWIILIARSILNDGQLPALELVLGTGLMSLLAFGFGWWIYARRAAQFVYYI